MNNEKPYPSWSARGPRAIPKLDVPRLRNLETDVMDNLRPFVIFLIARPFVALATFVLMVAHGWWLAAPIVMWFLYGSTLSALHHLIHGSLGLTPRWRRFWITTLGCLVAESGHGMQATHVLHHRDGSDSPDPEGHLEDATWAQLPVAAIKFRYRLALWGWNHGTQRARVGFEIGIHIALHIAALALLTITPVLAVYLVMMQASAIGFAVLLSKGPQTNYGREITTPLMFVHTKLVGLFLFNHHHHLEHHAYPKVPLARLGTLRPHIEDALLDQDVMHVHLAV